MKNSGEIGSMMKELITFVVPAYNAEKTLKRTIDSILGQTSDSYRIVIVNDGSKDSTEQICREYEASHPDRIVYISQENKGLGGARNTGLQHVETEYVSFLDSDDWLMPEYVENIERQLMDYWAAGHDHDVEMIMTLPKIYHEGSRAVRDWYDRKLFEEIFEVEPKAVSASQISDISQVENLNVDGKIICPNQEMKIYQFEVNQCRKVLQMDFVNRIHFEFREKIKWEDVFPHFWLLSQCQKCMGIGSVGFYYRIGSSDQITASRGSDRLDLLVVIQDLLTYIEQQELYQLRFPVMRVIVRFAIWGMRMSDMDTRKKFVKEMHKVFKKIPHAYYTELKKNTRKNYSKADARQYRLFMTAIRFRVFNPIFYDYFYQEVGEKTIKKLLGAGERVA